MAGAFKLDPGLDPNSAGQTEYKKGETGLVGIGAELNDLDLDHLIASPMIACAKAVRYSCEKTIEFMFRYGFKTPPVGGRGEVAMLEMRYERIGLNGERLPAVANIPLLSILPVPMLFLQSMTVDFNADLTHTQRATLDTSGQIGVKVGVGVEVIAVAMAQVSAAFAYRRQSHNESHSSRQYKMHFNYTIQQPENPEGIQWLKEMMEGLIKDQTVVPELPKKEEEEHQK
mmetsp:Transcript_18327/g.46588  ORF Transcript_18327/g.46588 Transcript_18327/m.46588 type:complete len:229 (+) Transcript_18327:272-958(+)